MIHLLDRLLYALWLTPELPRWQFEAGVRCQEEG